MVVSSMWPIGPLVYTVFPLLSSYFFICAGGFIFDNLSEGKAFRSLLALKKLRNYVFDLEMELTVRSYRV